MKRRLARLLAASLCVGLVLPTSQAFAKTETIRGEVSEQVRMYNTQRYKKARVGVAFKGKLAQGYCTFYNADNPGLGGSDAVRLPYGNWSLGVRYSSSGKQFTRLQFSGQYGSGTFPGTGGANGNFSTWFKINTRGSACGSSPAMPFSGTLNY